MATEYLEVVEKPVERKVEKWLRFQAFAESSLWFDIELETNAPYSLHIVTIHS